MKSQVETRVFFSPMEAEVIINQENQKDLEIMVENAVNIRAFDLEITYNPQVVSIISWSSSEGVIQGFIVENIQNMGYLKVAITKLAGTAFTGDGKLLSLTFQGISPGSTDVEINYAELSVLENGSILPTFPDKENGLINTTYNPDLLPKSTLSGTLRPQGQPDVSGVEITLLPGETYAIGPYTATTTTTGTYDFGDVVQDSYLITTAQPGYLNLSVDQGKEIGVSSSTTTITPLRLIGGNAVWQEEVDGDWVLNQEIDIFDVALISGELYGQRGEKLPGDVNGDGVINIIDLALVKGNFGLTAAAAYQNWQP